MTTACQIWEIRILNNNTCSYYELCVPVLEDFSVMMMSRLYGSDDDTTRHGKARNNKKGSLYFRFKNNILEPFKT
jgi:hypothetical protein